MASRMEIRCYYGPPQDTDILTSGPGREDGK